MKITIFISGVTGGGAEKVACTIASYMVSKGHEVDLLTMTDEEATYLLDNRVSRYCLLKEKERKNFFVNNTIRLVRLVKYLLLNRRDAYLAMLPTNIITILSMSFLTSAKVIAAERANPASYNESKQKKLIALASKADGWAFQTIEQKKWYEAHCRLKKTIVISNAINPDVLKQHTSAGQHKTIVTAGRLTNQKNHKLLIDAFSKIADKYKDYNLVIYGEGPNRTKLTEQITNLKLSNRILLPGYSPNVMLNVGQASMFVLSSDFEGMPNALMEAMALGVPSISTDCAGGCARYLINNGINGLLVPVNDVAALVAAMDRVLSDKEFAKQLGNESHKLCETLAPNVIYGQWEKYIKNIVNS